MATIAFLLLHRRRLWNPAEGRWMGWERKRGKLHEFNLLLQGSRDTSFMSVGGRAPQAHAGVRYVISLDADTRLPRGAALALIGKMAHPLNRPVIDTAKRRVTAGYGILQPRVTPSLPIGHEGVVLPKRIFRPERHRSLRVRGIGRLSRHVRRGFVQRQGNI